MRFWLGLVAGVVSAGLAGCERRDAEPVRAGMVVVSGDTSGWITPCGCASNQSGGLLRRGTYVQDLRKKADVLYVDAGGAAAGTTAYHRVKFEAILAGEMLMGLGAHNLGASELAMGVEYLRGLAQPEGGSAKPQAGGAQAQAGGAQAQAGGAQAQAGGAKRQGGDAGVPFISTNARSVDGEWICDRWRIMSIGGRRVAVLGVTATRYATAEIRLEDPRQAVLSAIEQIRGEYDFLVLLAYVPEQELAALAEALPEVDVIVGGPTGQAMRPRQVGPSVLASATNKGKFLVQLELPSDAEHGWRGTVVEIDHHLHDHAEQYRNLRAYLARLEEADFKANETGVVPAMPSNLPADYRIAGSQSCMGCHAAEYETWSKSAHAHAFETLEEGGYQVDPYCLSCHTTGFGMPGGFVSPKRTPQFVQVGCENCHGPSQAHVMDPLVRTTFNAIDQCIRCHDAENSPEFHQERYWAQIAHGPGVVTAIRSTNRVDEGGIVHEGHE